MLFYLTLIFCCELIGELVAVLLDLPIPGPVIGMALLFVGLLIRGAAPRPLEQVADGLLRHLSLLFVPAGVGVMMHAELIAHELLPITIALVVSTLLTIAVTALLMSRLDTSGDTGAVKDA